ncbi:MAG: epoxyqueuosine reductase [Candidatus Abyssobacteria bacterium SURF_5]|uniref:Epoxyqueuosine reductase n=1 Tax=Abyssobacteria bacterium (strain SURF_5) TaxID=2093360 RepID=A0A3A4N5T7_ABYX5|nr:MAG: epoxyqueuosine reductase [Candidatus Abyssubacteria bacterium SURF_5]
MISSNLIKETVISLGADLCAIAPVDRFADAPTGFHPQDICSDCRSVLVFAKRLPLATISAKSCIPYTFANSAVTQEVDLLTLEISRSLELSGIGAVPIPSDDPYEHWEPNRSYGRAILSLRHAGYLAGLGILGKNTLLINDRYGNMIQLGAVLLDVDLAGDPLAIYEACPQSCRLCIDSCPAGALDGETVNQHLCRPLSIFRNEKGYLLKKCYECRAVCPHFAGLENGGER